MEMTLRSLFRIDVKLSLRWQGAGGADKGPSLIEASEHFNVVTLEKIKEKKKPNFEHSAKVNGMFLDTSA